MVLPCVVLKCKARCSTYSHQLLASANYPPCAITSFWGAATAAELVRARSSSAGSRKGHMSMALFIFCHLISVQLRKSLTVRQVQYLSLLWSTWHFNLQADRRRHAEPSGCILTLTPGKASSALGMSCVGTQTRREWGFPIFQKPEGVRIPLAAEAESMHCMLCFPDVLLLFFSFQAGTDIGSCLQHTKFAK